MDGNASTMVVQVLQGAILQILILAGPTLGFAILIGLLVSIFQATTSIQDQTLTFVPKILAVMLVLGLLGNWMLNSLGNYTIRLFELMSQAANL